MLTWESVRTDPEHVLLWRAKVPGGWLIVGGLRRPRPREYAGGGVTFYPDPHHEWHPGVS